MTKISRSNLKVVFCFLLSHLFMNLYSQPSEIADEIIFKTYNMDFNEVPAKIEILKKTSPQIAKYLKVEYLWWKMISTFNSSTEALLLAEISSLHDKNSENENYNKLIYFIYQIRYDNFKKRSFTRYLNLLKFHIFLQNIDAVEIKKYDPFAISMFWLITEFDLYMEYKILSHNMFQTKKNFNKLKSSLERIENIPNPENKSFDIIKTYLLGKIYLDIEINYLKAFNKFQQLSVMFPKNIIFRETAAECKKHLINETGD